MLALFFLGLALPAHAGVSVTVGCAGASGGPFDFASLGAALGAITGNGDTITVSGTCTEYVVVNGVRNLRINGTPGAKLVDPGAADPSSLGFDAVLEIADSSVFVGLLTIQVASRSPDTAVPVVFVEGSGNVTLVTFRNCTIEGAGASDGIRIFGLSNVFVRGATVIENNNDGQGNGEGIFVDGTSSLDVVPAGAPPECPVIQGNGDAGILVGAGASARVRRCATIENNAIGILASGGSIVIRKPQATPGAIVIQGNAIGVNANNGGSLSIEGPVLIQNNTLDGVRLRSATGTLGGPTIQQNGAGPMICCALPAGVSVAQSSHLELFSGLVTNNFAPGLLVQDDSTVRIAGSRVQITNNPVGVAVTNLSTAALFLGPVISGNRGPDLSCSRDSVAYGDRSGVGRINCPGFKVQPLPDAPDPPPKSPF
jgi:hypothetical protein